VEIMQISFMERVYGYPKISRGFALHCKGWSLIADRASHATRHAHQAFHPLWDFGRMKHLP
jgi:hypothetical protein